ncbi:MAG TPA: tripartite tricarboxylate transporter TctB family protein [Thermodesulfobacteriota bacterium]|nr:tripartite tricarboxylate transporter TctB family protein [Thermodesulfobacteriota bacterium]
MKKDQIGGLLFLFFGVSFFFLSIKLPAGKFTQPGPGIFPLLLSILLSIIGVLIFFSRKPAVQTDRGRGLAEFWRPVTIILLTLGYILLLDRAGYMATSFLYLFGLFFIVARFKILFSVAISGALAVASWYSFGQLLGILLPLGPWNL